MSNRNPIFYLLMAALTASNIAGAADGDKNPRPKKTQPKNVLSKSKIQSNMRASGNDIARAGGGNGTGNGNDSLVAQTKDPSETVVNVPKEFAQHGVLRVSGMAGGGQGSKVDLLYCGADPIEKLPIAACAKQPISADLNSKVSLVSGTYLIQYSRTSTFAEVKDGLETVVPLKKLRVAHTPGISFEVSRDLADPSEQDRFLREVWYGRWFQTTTFDFYDNDYGSGSHSSYSFYEYFLDGSESQNEHQSNYPEIGNALKSGDYRRLAGALIRFSAGDSDHLGLGEYSSIQHKHRQSYENNSDHQTIKDYMSWTAPAAVSVTDPMAGDFISVFPGVYSITYTELQTGAREVTAGVVVR